MTEVKIIRTPIYLGGSWSDLLKKATDRGWNESEHLAALQLDDIDQVALTHPYNWLTEEEIPE